ncbi:MAG: hypothetical protein CMQ34_09070 [Gammaproteobacteria bacterium]|nr:hypothetical protein [Gammaproteobacteria bacterium]
MTTLAVQYDRENADCEKLAQKLDLPLINAPAQHEGLLLSYRNNRLTLSQPMARDAGAVCVDFCDTRLSFRLAQSLSREAVVKAVGGLAPKQSETGTAPHLIDATAGLGQDAFILAAAGWQVSLVEQSPVIHALLEDGLQRARVAAMAPPHQRLLETILPRLHLCEPGNSLTVLPTLPVASVIYLDPMFPAREKTARVKKNRYLLQHLHGEEGVGEGLLPLALSLATKVVVKRPRLAQPLASMAPASSLTGKTSRFDIYVGSPDRSAAQ